jgi:hypothetical protein
MCAAYEAMVAPIVLRVGSSADQRGQFVYESAGQQHQLEQWEHDQQLYWGWGGLPDASRVSNSAFIPFQWKRFLSGWSSWSDQQHSGWNINRSISTRRELRTNQTCKTVGCAGAEDCRSVNVVSGLTSLSCNGDGGYAMPVLGCDWPTGHRVMGSE